MDIQAVTKAISTMPPKELKVLFNTMLAFFKLHTGCVQRGEIQKVGKTATYKINKMTKEVAELDAQAKKNPKLGLVLIHSDIIKNKKGVAK